MQISQSYNITIMTNTYVNADSKNTEILDILQILNFIINLFKHFRASILVILITYKILFVRIIYFKQIRVV